VVELEEPEPGFFATPEKDDFLVEFGWKLTSFVHYNCFQEFKNNSVLHDRLESQLQAMFTDDILLRWYY